MKKYYEEKIEYIWEKFYELFVELLKKKNCQKIDSFIFFTQFAYEVKKQYPNISQRIDRVIYYHSEVDDSDEKLDYLMSLYKIIKESV